MSESVYLALSGIQHFAFCRRQWALIHIEQQWEENIHTTEGNILHERAHNDGIREMRGDTLTIRGLNVSSEKLMLNGYCDVVEFRKNPEGVRLYGRDGNWIPYPVEYKKGKPKQDACDQL